MNASGLYLRRAVTTAVAAVTALVMGAGVTTADSAWYADPFDATAQEGGGNARMRVTYSCPASAERVVVAAELKQGDVHAHGSETVNCPATKQAVGVDVIRHSGKLMEQQQGQARVQIGTAAGLIPVDSAADLIPVPGLDNSGPSGDPYLPYGFEAKFIGNWQPMWVY